MNNQIQFKANVLKAPIEVDEARKRHVDYLLNGPHIMMGKAIIHSLRLSGDDLDMLHRNGPKGARLYFCIDVENAGKPNEIKYLSIIGVPVGANEENVLTDGTTTKTALVNNFDPCPDKCPGDKTYRLSLSVDDLNYEKVDGKDVWCKPNLRTAIDDTDWFDNANGPIKHP